MNFKKADQLIRNLNHKRIDASRSGVLALMAFFLNRISRFTKGPIGDEPILVLRLDDKVGDSVTATGFLRELKRSHPKNKLMVVAGPLTAQIYRPLAFIDEIIIAKKGIVSTWRTFFKLNDRSFKYIINTSHILTPRVLFLTSLLKSYKKLSFLNRDYSLFSDHIDFNFHDHHVTERYRRTLLHLDIQEAKLHYELKVDDDLLKAAATQINNLKKGERKIIALNCFAGARLRNFKKDTTFKLVKGLLQNSKVVVVSIGNAGDLNVIKTWISELNDPRWVCFENNPGLFENCALVHFADLLITPDTAWVHLGSALQKKIIAVYREDSLLEKNSVIWSPYYHTETAIVMAPFHQDQPFDINTVNVDQIVELAHKMLGLS
ncbi:MAG: glycosyltransferase family 9 protein [Bdellovibrionaceae bacterium]|nr:glycosyltransferase family 9 protein [Bdellovibrio sp.]